MKDECWWCATDGIETPATVVNLFADKSGTRVDIAAACGPCAVEEARRDADAHFGRGWQAYSIYLPMVLPDTATQEQIISVEVMISRWTEFLFLCITL